MIAYNITKARKEKKELIHKEELKKLSDMALDVVARNFILYPELDNLPEKFKIRIYDKIVLTHPIEIIYPLINYEGYWKRACNNKFVSSNHSYHGHSWKQCYAENYLKELISNESEDEGIQKYFDLFKSDIFNLELNYYSADFDISLILQYFFNLTTLELKYSPNLVERKKENFFKKNLTPINEEYNKFGFRLSDVKIFSFSLTDMNYLLSLTLQGNLLDDECIKWLSLGLISNYTIRYLDLSNNYITDNGMIKLSSYLLRTKCLLSLDLSNNQLGFESGFVLSLVIKENTKLNLLKINMNRIGDKSGSKLFKSLARNKNLKELEISSNQLDIESSQGLALGLSINKSLKSIDISFNNIYPINDLKQSISEHTSLINLDLVETKFDDYEIEDMNQILIKRTIKEKLKK